MYPSVRAAWRENSREFRAADKSGNWRKMTVEIDHYLEHRTPRFFRIHVAGDFLSQAHVDFWADIAARHPAVKFLAFTKRHDLDYAATRFTNFTVVFSMFPGMPDTSWPYPKAWMQDGTETRVPTNAIECPGNCETCGMCFNLQKLQRDVVFAKH